MAKARRKKRVERARRRRPSARGAHAIEVALAGLAHDIRTPLTGILALAELLQASDLPPRERGWAEAIRSAADHLARLTTIVVDAAKADKAGLALRDEPFSLREFVQSMAGSVAARAESKQLTAAVSIARNLPDRVRGDEVRLRSALENLVDNAVKFTEHGSIGFSVSAKRTGRGGVGLVFVVTDSGIGITATDLKRLFKPFAQASKDIARRYGGAGLGLVLVKRLAKAMGGDLKVTSKPGRGSTFRLTVTVRVDAPAAHGRALNGMPTAGLRVLSVEDNPFGRLVHSAVLRELGHRVSFVGTGAAAVDAAAQQRHDVIMMDIALPDIDGIEATRRIRALPPPAGRIPIIGVSGRTEPSDAHAAREAGMDLYLRKPASAAELDEALRSVAAIVFSNEAVSASREENASKQRAGAPASIHQSRKGSRRA